MAEFWSSFFTRRDDVSKELAGPWISPGTMLMSTGHVLQRRDKLP